MICLQIPLKMHMFFSLSFYEEIYYKFLLIYFLIKSKAEKHYNFFIHLLTWMLALFLLLFVKYSKANSPYPYDLILNCSSIILKCLKMSNKKPWTGQGFIFKLWVIIGSLFSVRAGAYHHQLFYLLFVHSAGCFGCSYVQASYSRSQ